MGWITPHNSHCRSSVVKDIIGGISDRGGEVLCKRTKNFGRSLWLTIKSPGGPSFVCLYLLQRHEGEWSYKDVDESMGPVQVDCPLSIIEAADPPCNQFATEWRGHVVAYHKRRKYKGRLPHHIRFVKSNGSWIGEVYCDENTCVAWRNYNSVQTVMALVNSTLKPYKIPYHIETDEEREALRND